MRHSWRFKAYIEPWKAMVYIERHEVIEAPKKQNLRRLSEISCLFRDVRDWPL
jgi:hypothetical protein